MSLIKAWSAQQVREEPNRWCLQLSDEQRLALGGKESRAPVFYGIERRFSQSVMRDCGFLIVRGFGSSEREETERRLRALGERLGRAVAQNPDGSLVGYLEDREGSDWREEQPMHTDGGDTLALACIHPAAKGGISRLASAVRVYSIMAEKYPQELALLGQEWAFDRRGRPGPPTLGKRIFEWVDEELHCFHLPGTVRKTPRVHELPSLTEAQCQALDCLDGLVSSPEQCFEVMLGPGDLLILDNRVVLHSRTFYEDLVGYPKRLLLRMWWSVDRGGWRRSE